MGVLISKKVLFVHKKVSFLSNIERCPKFPEYTLPCHVSFVAASGLVYQRSSGKLVRFTEMCDINDEMQEIQYSVNEEDSNRDYFSKKLAKYINVFMIREIFRNLEGTVGYHASADFTGDQLFPVVWETTRVLESISFIVRNWVCDGAAPSRKFFLINSLEEEKRGRQY